MKIVVVGAGNGGSFTALHFGWYTKNRPDDFAKAVEVDYAVREAESLKYPFDVQLYTHRSLQPLDKVEFDPNKDQLDMFDEECEGICGI